MSHASLGDSAAVAYASPYRRSASSTWPALPCARASDCSCCACFFLGSCLAVLIEASPPPQPATAPMSNVPASASRSMTVNIVRSLPARAHQYQRDGADDQHVGDHGGHADLLRRGGAEHD